MRNQFSENCYWLVIGSTVHRFLRRGYSKWGLVLPPWLKPFRLHVPNRSGFSTSFRQWNFVSKSRSNSLVTWAKWSNNAMITISFYPRTSITHALSSTSHWYFSSSYIKRKTTNVNNVSWTTTFNVHLNTYLSWFFLTKKENESLLVCTRCCQNREKI